VTSSDLTETDRGRKTGWLSIPPPLAFVVAFICGRGLDRLVATGMFAETAAKARPVGFALVAVGALFAVSAVATFIRRWTTIVPHGRPRVLVTTGAYRVTRNPMYVGLTLAYVGVAVLTCAVAPLATLLLPLWFLSAAIIPREERSLLETFGDDYRRYAARTRRWI
jgi:protein-S-isoprenylcysteine O-methyltransferase Ste14